MPITRESLLPCRRTAQLHATRFGACGGTPPGRSIVTSVAQLHAAPDAAPQLAAFRALYFSVCGSAPVSSGPLGA